MSSGKLVIGILMLGLIALLNAPVITPVYAQQNQGLTGNRITRARLGPDFAYTWVYDIPPQSVVELIAISPDENWLQINYLNLFGWVEKSALTIEGEMVALPQSLILPPAPVLPFENCISLVGDSVPHGDVVYMIPGQGFGVVRTTPLSVILHEQLVLHGLGYLEVRDRTASAAFLSVDGKLPYINTPEYAALQADNCRFIVIMPWINDLSVEREDNATAHIQDITGLLETLHQTKPNSKMLVLGFYYGQRADFVELYAPGYTNENITLFNEEILAACRLGGVWDQLQYLTCMETEPLFVDLNFQHVVQSSSRMVVEGSLYEPIPADMQPLFDVFWRDNPDGHVTGDGVHLNQVGKRILADAIIARLLWIEPRL